MSMWKSTYSAGLIGIRVAVVSDELLGQLREDFVGAGIFRELRRGSRAEEIGCSVSHLWSEARNVTYDAPPQRIRGTQPHVVSHPKT